MIALSTVLSLIKIIDMPYGGSVTVASMLPIVIAAYRHGAIWGLGTAMVNSAMQLLLGLNNLSYFSAREIYRRRYARKLIKIKRITSFVSR